MASNKHVDLRQIENFVRSKCYPEDIFRIKIKKRNVLYRKILYQKIKEKANLGKSCKNFKIVNPF